ncbi:7641_t:CDS:2, partial [Cetraspora pellucida]
SQKWTKTKPLSPSGVVRSFYKKGWIDELGMLAWTNSYIEVKAKLYKNNNDLVVILGSLTFVCQPLDVSINYPFKDEILSNKSKEISQNETHHASNKHNVITINSSNNEKDCNAIIEKNAIIKKDAIIEEVAIIEEDKKVLVFTIN